MLISSQTARASLWTLFSAVIVAAFFPLGAHGGSHATLTSPNAVAVIHPTGGNTASGIVEFYADDEGVRVQALISGLAPSAKHGFHIHEYGDCSAANGTSAGGHYDPAGAGHHGLPDAKRRHAGDMGNLEADGNGSARYDATLADISIAGKEPPIMGRGVIVHALMDDGGQPTGNAGARIGCGVVGFAKPD